MTAKPANRIDTPWWETSEAKAKNHGAPWWREPKREPLPPPVKRRLTIVEWLAGLKA